MVLENSWNRSKEKRYYSSKYYFILFKFVIVCLLANVKALVKILHFFFFHMGKQMDCSNGPHQLSSQILLNIFWYLVTLSAYHLEPTLSALKRVSVTQELRIDLILTKSLTKHLKGACIIFDEFHRKFNAGMSLEFLTHCKDYRVVLI